MKKYYLVTGGNGYIGQNLCSKNWTQNGRDIEFIVCDKDTILPRAEKLNINHLKKFDGVVHLAALSGIFACEKSPESAAVDNIMTAGNVFRLATELNIPVVFTSSQAAKTPDTSIYANMKWACEALASYYNGQGGKIYVVRLANVYGGDNYLEMKETCVKQFIYRYKNDMPFEIHGDGCQTRDFVHVWDVCMAINKIINMMPDYSFPIDIGTGKGISILDLKNMFPPNVLEFTGSRNAGAKSSIADISILRDIIGFVPSRELKDYIKGEIDG